MTAGISIATESISSRASSPGRRSSRSAIASKHALGREQNVRDDKDPTYPDQTTLGARLKVTEDTSIFYTQRISDEAIVPIGDFTATGFSQLATKGELNIGVESQVKDATQLTSAYRVEQGVNGPDAFALIGVFTHVKLGRTSARASASSAGSSSSGARTATRADRSRSTGCRPIVSRRRRGTKDGPGRIRSRLSAGVATRLHAGITGLDARAVGESADHDGHGRRCGGRAGRAGRAPGDERPARVAAVLSVRRSGRAAADGRARPLVVTAGAICSRLTATRTRSSGSSFTASSRGSGSEACSALDGHVSLAGTRAVRAVKRFVDARARAAVPLPAGVQLSSRGHGDARSGSGRLADMRIALGYNFHDTRDPFGRDLQGRDKGVVPHALDEALAAVRSRRQPAAPVTSRRAASQAQFRPRTRRFFARSRRC